MPARPAERRLRAVSATAGTVPAIDALNRSAAFCDDMANRCDHADAAKALRVVAADLRLRRFELQSRRPSGAA